MKLKVRCKKHKAENGMWTLEAGLLYEAIKINDDLITVINHYENAVSLTLKEFNMYCEIVQVVS